MTEKAISAFQIVKDLLAYHTSRVIINAHDPLILYTDAFTRAIVGVFQVGGDGTLRFRVLREES